MLPTQILDKSINYLKTTDSMYNFLYEASNVHNYLYKSTGGTVFEIINSHMSNENAQFLKEFLQGKSLVEASNLLKELEDELKKISKFSITMAFKYDAGFAESLFLWVQKNMPGKYLLEFSYDPEIIGGCVLSYDGHYKDYSLRKELQKFFQGKNGLHELI